MPLKKVPLEKVQIQVASRLGGVPHDSAWDSQLRKGDEMGHAACGSYDSWHMIQFVAQVCMCT